MKLIIDTNLLLLLIIGNVDGGTRIRDSKRLQAYSVEDQEKILVIMSQAQSLHITPYIAAEVSNLIDLKRYVKDMVMQEAALVFETFECLDVDIRQDSLGEFPRLGLTDNSLLGYVKDYTILTDDGPLSHELRRINATNVINLTPP
ncbi:hypothetical protein ACV6DN_18560 [Enterobacter asburiae]